MLENTGRGRPSPLTVLTCPSMSGFEVSTEVLEGEMTAARPRVGLIGLGGMGRGIAQNLLKNGYPAAVYDIRPEAVRDSAAQGAIPCASSAEVGAHSDIVMLIPFSYTDVRSILLEDGLLAALAPGSTIVVMATVGPAEAREVARLAAEQNVRTLDAPVSGGPHGAEEGTLAVMVGGPPEVLETCRGPLEAISKRVFHIGPNPGDGQTAKMVNQLLVAVHMAAAAEAMVLGAKAGLDLDILYEAISSGGGDSFVFRGLVPQMIRGDFDPRGIVDIWPKDLGVVLSTAHACQAPVFFAGLALQIFEAARALGHGAEGHASVVRVYENLARIRLADLPARAGATISPRHGGQAGQQDRG